MASFRYHRCRCSRVVLVILVVILLLLIKPWSRQYVFSIYPKVTSTLTTPATYNLSVLTCPGSLRLSTDGSYRHRSLAQISPFTQQPQWKHFVWNQTILIVTPVCNSQKYLLDYFKLLCSLSYPHHLISVAIGEDSSSDKTYELAVNISKDIQPYFRKVSVYHFNNTYSVSREQRHNKDLQLVRRSHLASSRNRLLQTALQEQDWVLWLDVDLDYYPPDILQHLLSAQKPVIVPNCLRLHNTYLFYQNYDLNNFRETNASLQYLKDKPDDFLMLSDSWTPRMYLPDIKNEGLVVHLDGVGGCVLLIEAKYHHRGLLFPTKIIDHHIETEGLGKLAIKMGLNVSGLPFVNTVHRRDSIWE